jgi:glutamate racemase
MSIDQVRPFDVAPIGVFDSGIGGLTVVRAIRDRLPGEAIVYLGDTARVPYGTKSPETVIRYARACARMLMHFDVKLLVVACNTASAHALYTLQDEVHVPVVGVIEPGALAAAEASQAGHIGVVGTRGTVESGAYQQALSRLAPKASVHARPCPMFVPLAEEGWLEGEVPTRVAREYLQEFIERDVDSLLLACTHYPLLTRTIASVMGPNVIIVDSAQATAVAVAETLEGLGLANPPEEAPGRLSCLVSDSPERFAETGRAFLGADIDEVTWVDV